MNEIKESLAWANDLSNKVVQALEDNNEADAERQGQDDYANRVNALDEQVEDYLKQREHDPPSIGTPSEASVSPYLPPTSSQPPLQGIHMSEAYTTTPSLEWTSNGGRIWKPCRRLRKWTSGRWWPYELASSHPQSTQTKVLDWNSGQPERMENEPLTAPDEWFGTQ